MNSELIPRNCRLFSSWKKQGSSRQKIIKRITNHWELYLFLLPAVIYIIIFKYMPMYGIQIAFKNYNPAIGIAESPWVGFLHIKNFINGLYFWRLIANTMALSLYSLVFGFPLPIIMALMVNELNSMKYKKVIQTTLYAPHFISTVVMVGIIVTMFSPSIGVVNRILELLGNERIYFLTLESAFRHLYIWSGNWQELGWGMIIYIAALSTVDPQLYEAASIDGASRLRRIIHINIPTILPVIIILLIMRIGHLATVGYEKIYLLQNDLNISVSEVISTYVYKRGIMQGQFSFAAGVDLFNNLFNVTLLLLANTIAKKTGETSLF